MKNTFILHNINVHMENNIYITNKPVGMTSKECAEEIKEKYNLKKVCFCGRLDPMARGKMLFLGNEMCKKMDNYKNLNKTYRFNICFGLQTDSDDPLGILENYTTDFNFNEISKKIVKTFDDFKGEFEQHFHKYSSIKINGDPYWLHTKENKEVIDKPKHKVKINSIKILDLLECKNEAFFDTILDQIDRIDPSHDFRQEEISKMWNDFCFKYEENIFMLPIEINVTSGFYVRQFVRDISEKINFPLMVYDINRINIDLV